ncbi:MAG: hypothetical protein ACKVHP_23630 [Verrucomicrobiales bacterium]
MLLLTRILTAFVVGLKAMTLSLLAETSVTADRRGATMTSAGDGTTLHGITERRFSPFHGQ